MSEFSYFRKRFRHSHRLLSLIIGPPTRPLSARPRKTALTHPPENWAAMTRTSNAWFGKQKTTTTHPNNEEKNPLEGLSFFSASASRAMAFSSLLAMSSTLREDRYGTVTRRRTLKVNSVGSTYDTAMSWCGSGCSISLCVRL